MSEFPKKYAKYLTQEWMDSTSSNSTEELKKNVVVWEQAISSFEKDMDADIKISALKDKMKELKEEMKEASEPYVEGLKGAQAMIRYAIYLLDSRGTGR